MTNKRILDLDDVLPSSFAQRLRTDLANQFKPSQRERIRSERERQQRAHEAARRQRPAS